MAVIKKHESLVRADKVLRAVNALGLSKFAAEHFRVEAWDNCREQGYVLKAYLFEPIGSLLGPQGRGTYNVGVFFAQDRGSDATVVCIDSSAAAIGNHPSDKAWEKSRKHFNSTETKKAAKYIRDFVERAAAEYKPHYDKLMEGTK
jgi:hypothetical protein